MRYRKIVPVLFIVAILIQFSCARRVVNNPYLTMKVKPSEQLMRDNNRVDAELKREYFKELKKSKKIINEKNKKFFRMKKHYHKTSRRRRGRERIWNL